MSDSEEEEHIPSASAIEKVAVLGNKPHKQLSALRRLLGVNCLLHYVDPESNPKPKGSYHFILICHEALGDTLNSLFPKKTEDQIFALSCAEVWAEVVAHLSKVSKQNPARLRMELHTLSRGHFSST